MRKDEREEREGRRILYAGLMLLLMHGVRDEFAGLTTGLAYRRLSSRAWAGAILQVLNAAHLKASVYGRASVGGSPIQTSADVARVAATMRGQDAGLQRFLVQIETKDPRYVAVPAEQAPEAIREGPILGRLELYNERLRGTAAESAVFSLPETTVIRWVLGENENHCRQCPDIAQRGPYTPRTLPTVPGSGDTDCGNRCKCRLIGEDGVEIGF